MSKNDKKSPDGQKLFFTKCFPCLLLANTSQKCKGIPGNLSNECQIEIVLTFNKDDVHTKCSAECPSFGPTEEAYLNSYIKENAPIIKLLHKVDHKLVSECFLGTDETSINKACGEIIT